MRRLSFLFLLVIILVSLTWFRELLAQDLLSLSPEDKQQLMEQYRQRQPKATHGDVYHSPEIYNADTTGQTGMSRPPADTAATSGAIITTSTPHDTTGLTPFSRLQPFGTELFTGVPTTAPPNDISADEDYVLGPGDNVIIFLWGRAEKQFELTVDREGKVFIPRVGSVSAWGQTLAEFETQVRARLQKVYDGAELHVTLGKIRSIRVYVTGEVKRPGAYITSSLTSLFNALYLAGGPNRRGSMRSIALMRNGRKVAEFDLYKFLLEGDNSHDIRLQSGDAVFVPVAGSRVAIRGEIIRPGIYELRKGETALTLLSLAGNATPHAHLSRVMLERISEQAEWEVIDLNLSTDDSSSVDDIELVDGDRLTIYSIFDARTNIVAIAGQVKHAGYYERNEHTRVSDLICQAELQDYDVYYDRANLFRRHHDRRFEVVPVDLNAILSGDSLADLLLQDRDSLYVYSVDDIVWNEQVYIDGSVRQPGRYRYYDSMTVSDLVFLAGSYTREASLLRAEVARTDSLGNVTIMYINLDTEPARKTVLQEGDRLYIRRVPEWQWHRTVALTGEVMYPGEYVLADRGETLYQLLQRAGGFTRNAFPQGMIFERRSISENLERLQISSVLERSTPLVEDSLGNLVRESTFDYELSSMNRVIIDADALLSSGGRDGDLVLEPGDRVHVPPIPSGISVLGAVGANGTIKYVQGKNARYYLERAGDFTPRSDKGGTRLIRANGEVISGGKVMGKKVQLGDVIVVPSKIERDRDWGKTITTVLSATASVLTTVLLIDRL